MEIKDNKTGVPMEHYLARYRELDLKEVSARTGLSLDGDGRFALRFLKRRMYAASPEFSLMPENPDDCPKTLLKPAAQMLVMRYLLEGVAAPDSGKLLSYREVPWGNVYDANFQGRCVKRLAYAFASRQDVFAAAAERLGAERVSAGDIAYDFAFFENVRVRLILYAADEEFPPTSQFLFSDSAPFAFTAEDLAVVGDILIDALKETEKSL